MKVLGVDWGTSSLRVYLLSEEGEIIGQGSSDRGLTAAREYGFAKAFEETAGRLLEKSSIVMLSGMVGAREGWMEAQYCPCPADCAKLADSLVELPELSKPAWIAPGVAKMDNKRPDVMRGEETQIFGALEAGGGDGVYVLPGTHTKWAQVANGKIVDFTTFMTGDVFQALSAESVLRLMIDKDEPWDKDAFAAGVEAGQRAAANGMLLSELFGARALGLFGQLPKDRMGNYLSGMLMGNEISSATSVYQSAKVTLVGAPKLLERYEAGCALLDIATERAPENVVVFGQLALAKAHS